MNSIIGKILYKLIASKLPKSDTLMSFKAKEIRYFCVKAILKDRCGKNVNVDRNANFGDIEIGDYSGIGANSIVESYTHIGKYVMMGPDCKIYTRNHNINSTDKPMCFQGFQGYKDVYIGNDVWIGANVIILPGVIIEDGCVIGAGSVVTKNVPKNSIACGNPAVVKKIRRYEDGTINE